MNFLNNEPGSREDISKYYTESCCTLPQNYRPEPCTNTNQYGMGCDCKRSPDCVSNRCGGTPDLCFSADGERHIEPFTYYSSKRLHPYSITKNLDKNYGCCGGIDSTHPLLSGPI